ncbi:MAG: 2-C-methyl-D-erythritol 4-phosphate cytidylyltransferase [Candidatus Omnitrophica bacterium]|nr:2-C-methyl-D-erythritol 4-phosphate cytidylyltransferase [Candidatus Omnitrophota bacterium]
MKVCVLVPAAGLGKRLKTKVIKPLVLINKQPIIIHTLRKLSSHPLVSEIIVIFNSKHITRLKSLIKRNKIKKIKAVVKGGATRAQSVKNGLKEVKGADLVLIHDGVRPFIKHKIITQAINKALQCGAAIVGMPVKSTIKRVNDKKTEVSCTLRRDEVWEIQTPQVFKKDLIMKAYENIDSNNANITDDAFLVERLGQRIALVKGSSFNIKITTPDDLILAKAIFNIDKS